VRGVLGELNGRTATVEKFDNSTKALTCSVEMQGGLEEVVVLTAANLVDVVPPRVKKPPKAVHVERKTATDYFFPEHPNSRMQDWWAVYKVAFRAEHEWLERRGHRTSSGLDTDPELMLGLVFREPQAPFARHCFFAFAAGDKDACGFATVDVDPHPHKVCHLRMLMVDPSSQGMGVGLALLEHVVDQFKTRSLGLKFVNHRDLEAFYQKAGFKRIGQDVLYTYMAIRKVQ